MAELRLFSETVDELASRLDLREPNKAAVETIAAEVSQRYDVEGKAAPLEAVIVSATGVGKTYILIAAMELFAAAYGVRDFVIVTPGRTILNKTKDNFTPGHQKSLLGPMSFQPVVITSDNFNTPAMRAAMNDPLQVKVYLFTVQALINPESNVARKTHKFQEGLGEEFYTHLQSIEQLVVFADEHHTYYGPAFSKAVRELKPWVLLGLTATPDPKTPEDEIIFRYPLAAAIAEKLVKTPVIVGRKDDRTDMLTKLTDGIALLDAKATAIAAYSAATGVRPVNPVMLVVAQDIEEAEESGQILRSPNFFGGRFADAVLVVHSKAPDVALEQLSSVEDPTSKVRIIISVGMLKEGWDVRNVYVIASLRASVSKILTEQTLGRGMRLPFGAYTNIEILDTLEVVAHEKYEQLLKAAGVLTAEAFIDHRTRAALRFNAAGQLVAVKEDATTTTQPLVLTGAALPSGEVTQPGPVVTSVDNREKQVGNAIFNLKQTIARRANAPPIVIPILRMSAVKSSFSLADITDTHLFRVLGESLAADPENELARTVVSAKFIVGPDGMKRTVLVTSPAVDIVPSNPTLFALEDLRNQLLDMVLASPAVPARKDQRAGAAPLMEAFFNGLGQKAVEVLSAYLDRAGARLVRLVAVEQRRFMAKPSYDQVLELRNFDPHRATDRPTSPDRLSAFSKSVAYDDWKRSLFAIEWFDSKPERTLANMLDEEGSVVCWVRLHLDELPILWTSAGQEYNPDFIVIEADGTHWVVEVKMDKEMTSEDVKGKRDAARRWANHVTADPKVGVTWKYLLVSESDVETSKGSWTALMKLGGE